MLVEFGMLHGAKSENLARGNQVEVGWGAFPGGTCRPTRGVMMSS